jgi:hypothetical protein
LTKYGDYHLSYIIARAWPKYRSTRNTGGDSRYSAMWHTPAHRFEPGSGVITSESKIRASATSTLASGETRWPRELEALRLHEQTRNAVQKFLRAVAAKGLLRW